MRALVAAVTIAIAVSFSTGFLAGAIMERSRRISNQAAIKAVGVAVYQDPELVVPLTEINWDILEPREEKNHTAYLKNESNARAQSDAQGTQREKQAGTMKVTELGYLAGGQLLSSFVQNFSNEIVP